MNSASVASRPFVEIVRAFLPWGPRSYSAGMHRLLHRIQSVQFCLHVPQSVIYLVYIRSILAACPCSRDNGVNENNRMVKSDYQPRSTSTLSKNVSNRLSSSSFHFVLTGGSRLEESTDLRGSFLECERVKHTLVFRVSVRTEWRIKRAPGGDNVFTPRSAQQVASSPKKVSLLSNNPC
jgi:hypothetical protein